MSRQWRSCTLADHAKQRAINATYAALMQTNADTLSEPNQQQQHVFDPLAPGLPHFIRQDTHSVNAAIQLANMSADQDDNSNVWEVEKVLSSRYNDEEQCMEYLLAWRGFPNEYTWEKEQDCDCDKLIKAYEREAKRLADLKKGKSTPQPKTPQAKRRLQPPRSSQRKTRQSASKKQTPVRQTITISDTTESSSEDDNSIENRSESDSSVDIPPFLRETNSVISKRKLHLTEIVSAINGGEGHITLVVRWANVPEPEKVPLVILRRLYPQEVIDFLLGHLQWIPE